MNKAHLIEHIRFALEQKRVEAQEAANAARESATHEQSAAETQYDSLSIEYSYLAEGQSERVDLVVQSIKNFEATYSLEVISKIQVGAVVKILDEQDMAHWFYIGPSEGGLKVTVAGVNVLVITLGSSIGKQLVNLSVGDEIEALFQGSKQALYLDYIA